MADRLLSNPAGANQLVTDFRLGVDAAGKLLDYYNESVEYLLSGTVTKGDVVSRVSPTAATTPVTAAQAPATAITGYQVIGVASKSGVAGDVIPVITKGYTKVQVGAGAPAVNDVAKTPASVAGRADVTVAATGVVAADPVGTILGQFLGAKDASNLAPVWLEHL